eukprot:1024947-Amphidinium_carterae.1
MAGQIVTQGSPLMATYWIASEDTFIFKTTTFMPPVCSQQPTTTIRPQRIYTSCDVYSAPSRLRTFEWHLWNEAVVDFIGMVSERLTGGRKSFGTLEQQMISFQ